VCRRFKSVLRYHSPHTFAQILSTEECSELTHKLQIPALMIVVGVYDYLFNHTANGGDNLMLPFG
jgi:hypothetical protein